MIAIRGATTVERDEKEEVIRATQELLLAMLKANGLPLESVVAIVFSSTSDITSAYPASAARELGWTSIPLFSAQEPMIKGALPLCIRVLMFADMSLERERVRHIYLKGASQLRPDLSCAQPYG